MDFKSLKKNSDNFDSLLKQVEKMNGGGNKYERDETDNYWKLTPDKAGNALAVIRFLPGPAVDGEDALPWVRYFDHGFQSKATGKWYIEKSLTTFEEKDPVSEYNNMLWGDRTNRDPNFRVDERKQARDQKRRLHYVANIYVVSDPKNPENEGKVFLFKFGKKIMDKILKMMNPDLESEPRINPTHLWKGANFKLKMTRQSGFPNYDESVFLAPGPLSEDDSVLEGVWKSEYSLKEIVDRKNFKSYDQLKARLDEVLGESEGPVSRSSAPQPRGTAVSDQVDDEEVPWKETPKAKAPVIEEDEEDEDLAMFRKLADD